MDVERFEGPYGRRLQWRFVESESGWLVTDSDDATTREFVTLTDALRESGCCAFAPGVALDIRTGGAVSPFALLPALQDWTESVHAGSPLEDYDWSSHPRMRLLSEVLEYSAQELDLDTERMIRIDDGFCGVHLSGGYSREHPVCTSLIIFKDMDPPSHEFYDLWAWTSTDNGWAFRTEDIGEIVPGLQGEVQMIGDSGHPHLTVGPLSENHPAGLYDAMVSWIADSISTTSGFEEVELTITINGSDVVVDLGQDPPGEASGWLGRTALNSSQDN